MFYHSSCEYRPVSAEHRANPSVCGGGRWFSDRAVRQTCGCCNTRKCCIPVLVLYSNEQECSVYRSATKIPCTKPPVIDQF